MSNLPVLPVEIVDKIVFYAGFNVAYSLNNKHVMNKIIQQFKDKEWELIFKEADGYLIRYLYDRNINRSKLEEFKEYFSPYYDSDIYHIAVENDDLVKIEMIDKILPNSSVHEKTYNLASEKVKEWVDKTRPNFFISVYTK